MMRRRRGVVSDEGRYVEGVSTPPPIRPRTDVHSRPWQLKTKEVPGNFFIYSYLSSTKEFVEALSTRKEPRGSTDAGRRRWPRLLPFVGTTY